MNKIIVLVSLIGIGFKASAQLPANLVDTILVGSIEKNCPGGFEAFNMYIKKNVHPPIKAFENHKIGTSYLSFIIEPDGSVTNVYTILAAGNGMDEEAIRVIHNSKNWHPAIIDNTPVKCFCRAAIQYFADFKTNRIWVEAKRID